MEDKKDTMAKAMGRALTKMVMQDFYKFHGYDENGKRPQNNKSATLDEMAKETLTPEEYAQLQKDIKVDREEMTMNPGKELDALIAENVMRHTVRRNVSQDTIEMSAPGNKFTYIAVPNYSTKIEIAWSVIEQVYEKTGTWLKVIKVDKDRYMCKEEDGIPGDGEFDSYADTAPHAICLAALKAMEK